MSKYGNPILITGSHRSGTTWVGQMLTAAPNTAYLHEPFNKDVRIRVSSNSFQYSYEYLDEFNSKNYEDRIGNLMKYRYPLASNIMRIRSIRDAAKITRDQFLFLKYKSINGRPVIKDPFSLFFAEWAHKKFSMDVLIMIRHPAAFCSSLKLKNWNFDFNNFLEQPSLMDGYLEKFSSEISEQSESKHDIIDQGILLWNCVHHTILRYQKNHPDWLFVKHEDLSRDPMNGFKSIYDQFGLEFTEKAKSKILKSSGTHNPVEQKVGNEFIRNSVRNIDNWKRRLTEEEIVRIKEKTREVSGPFYNDDDW